MTSNDPRGLPQTPLLEVRGLTRVYPPAAPGGGPIQALRGVDLQLGAGEILGLVGESGCGKTTLGRCILRIEEPSAGQIRFDGVEITRLSQRRLRPLRRQLQMIFQDPFTSLDPRMTVQDLVGEPLKIHRLVKQGALREQVEALLQEVGLSSDALDRFPHEFSGGQRQRIGIARALALRPRLVVADEPVSALDVSVQAQIVDLLAALQRRHGLSYLFISHDLRVVRHLCGRVAVMYLGQIVEEGPAQAVASPRARHPYTRALVAATPVLHPAPDAAAAPARQTLVLRGEVPSPADPPAGCAFHPRCPVYAQRQNPACAREAPALRPEGSHRAACHEDLDC